MLWWVGDTQRSGWVLHRAILGLKLRTPFPAPGALPEHSGASWELTQGGSVPAAPGQQVEGPWPRSSRRGRGPPEVVGCLLQVEGVVRPAVRVPSIQVAVPVDIDAHGTSLRTAHCCSTGTRAWGPLPKPSWDPALRGPTSNARSSKTPPAAATRSPMRNTGQ